MEISIGQITDFYKAHPECMGKVSVKTRHGYFPINAAEITAYNSDVYQVITESGFELKCSPDHRLLNSDEKWIHTKNLKQGDYIFTVNGKEQITSLNKLDYKDDLYDIEVAEKHEYYSNNIVSHNSSLLDALTFALYGKAFREIKKDLLINTTNKKNMLVECELIGNNGKVVIVKRGSKPNIFEIYEDGVLVNQNAESRDYQGYLETNIIGMNFITFIQTVIISKTRYTPFMRLKAADRRAFVESILNIEIFGDMLKLQGKKVTALKNEESEVRTSITIDKNNLSNKVDSMKRLKGIIAQIQQESLDGIKSEIDELNSKINELNIKNEELFATLDTNDYSADVNKYKLFSNKLIEINSRIDGIKRDIKKSENTSDKCHVCGSPMDISHVEKHITELTESLNTQTALFDKVKAAILDLQPVNEKYSQQQDYNRNINFNIDSNKRMISNYKSSIVALQNKKVDTSQYDAEVTTLKSDIINMNNYINEQQNNYQLLVESLKRNTVAHTLLKDSGIKAAAIQNNIGTINHIINDYLHKFGFFINFELDSEFNETIYIRGLNNLTYNNFSEGEKLRVDLALILAWRELSLMQSGMSCNLLFFDEITDASMDVEGVELFAKALNSLKNTNVWIISHTPEKLENYVRGYISLDKVDGFTVIQQNK